MAITDEDVESLLRLIESRHELRERFRAIVRDERLEELTRAVRDLERRTVERFAEVAAAQKGTDERLAALAAAQKGTDERLAALTEEVRALAVAQKGTDERLAALTEEVRALAVAQKRTDERLAALTEEVRALAVAQKRTDERLAALTEEVRALAVAQKRTEETVGVLGATMGGMKGQLLEMRYRDRAVAYFGRLLRRVKVVDPGALQEALAESLSDDELFDALNADLVVSGTSRSHPEVPEIWVAVEVSSVVDRNDVTRAVRRAALLRRAGRPVVPAVAGERVDDRALDEPGIAGVLILEDGRAHHWESALAGALPHPPSPTPEREGPPRG